MKIFKANFSSYLITGNRPFKVFFIYPIPKLNVEGWFKSLFWNNYLSSRELTIFIHSKDELVELRNLFSRFGFQLSCEPASNDLREKAIFVNPLKESEVHFSNNFLTSNIRIDYSDSSTFSKLLEESRKLGYKTNYMLDYVDQRFIIK